MISSAATSMWGVRAVTLAAIFSLCPWAFTVIQIDTETMSTKNNSGGKASTYHTSALAEGFRIWPTSCQYSNAKFEPGFVVQRAAEDHFRAGGRS